MSSIFSSASSRSGGVVCVLAGLFEALGSIPWCCWARVMAVAGASGSKLIGMDALLPWTFRIVSDGGGDVQAPVGCGGILDWTLLVARAVLLSGFFCWLRVLSCFRVC